MINKVLIANRGEIAVRVMRTCREMGIKSVAVYSDADRNSTHVRMADEAYYIGSSPSAESYLVIDKIIEAAKALNADAIHPGYGFLSENAKFSDRCKEEGIVFIGPTSEVIGVMGDKISARRKMIAADVSVVPGTKDKIENDEDALRIVKEIGLPVMIKASAGGGGKGMRLVHKAEDILSAVRSAKSEALAGFGDETVYVEKYVQNPHHIEIQVLGDSHGNVIHLFERECSVQRRHQKVVEEAPSPLMTPELRAKMGAQAVMAAKAVNYVGAGTIEFLVDDDLNYYFLEMNTRLQVEHPITEQITGVDLVRMQIMVADGQAIPFKQEELKIQGHAIEARVYAEDPYNNFMPSPGLIRSISQPLGPGVRHDGYVYAGYQIPIYYDPMISKLIVWGSSRQEAIARMKRSLYYFKISGINTNIPFLEKIMESDDFASGNYNTHFIEKNEEFLLNRKSIQPEIEDLAIATAFIHHIDKLGFVKTTNDQIVPDSDESQWKSFGKRKGLMRL
jgi:acetyl-CoA carboxylase biotin carboxylase subunit